MPTYFLSDLNRWAKSEGGKCTSNDYYGLKTLHRWMCRRGHTFDLMPIYVRQGAWCPQCSKVDKSEEAVLLMQELAKKQGGKCLSKNYVRHDEPLKWQCKNKHTFKASRHIIQSRKNFCTECAVEYRLEKNLKKVKEIVEKKGGKCLSEKYVSRFAKMKFQCEKGHVWETSFQSVYFDRSWCTYCMPNKKLEIEDIKKESKKRGWTCLSKTVGGNKDKLLWKCKRGHKVEMMVMLFQRGYGCGKCSRLDSKEAALKLMQKWAEKRGGKCLSTEYINTATNLLWECKNGHQIKMSRDVFKMRKDTWCTACTNDNRKKERYEEVVKYARRKGGKCLSKSYSRLSEPIAFECAKGHRWKTPPQNILYSGTWCPACIPNAKLDIETMKQMAREKGGECLSTKYVNNTTELKWKCKKGHIWESRPANIRQGIWCPTCGLEKQRRILKRIKR
ncbi:MAG: hypothetical protein WDZ35_09480 [Crocinitomicaceae bacterium]